MAFSFQSLFSNQFDIQTNDYVNIIKGTRTRQKYRGNFLAKECRLKKTRENFWHRAACPYNLFSKKVKIEEQTDITEDQTYNTLLGLLRSTLQQKQLLHLEISRFLWKLQPRSETHGTVEYGGIYIPWGETPKFCPTTTFNFFWLR